MTDRAILVDFDGDNTSGCYRIYPANEASEPATDGSREPRSTPSPNHWRRLAHKRKLGETNTCTPTKTTTPR